MSDDDALLRDVIARLKHMAGEGRVVTSADIAKATDHLPAEMIDIEAIDSAVERAGLVWEFENPGPPVFPPGYSGLRVVSKDGE